LPIMAPIAALGLAGATAARAEPAGDRATATSATEACPYGPFSPNGDMSSTGNEDRPLGSGPAASQAAGNSFDQGPTSAGTFDDRFGRWSVTPNGITPDRPSTVSEPRAVGAIAPEEVRRLTRVNGSNAGSVFASGSTPIPYLPPAEFNDRFGSWSAPIGEGPQQQASKPIGVFADEPSYLIPPPIFGMDDPGNPRNDAEEWFSRWIGPLLRPE